MLLAVTPFQPTTIPALLDAGADILLLGTANHANRLTASYSNLEIQDATTLAHSRGKQVYVNVNQIVHHNDLAELEQFLDFLASQHVDGIVFGDVSVYQLAKDRGLSSKLIYNPETLNTNYYDPIFWGKQGIKGITIAKEIPLVDIKRIHETSPIQLSMVGHGHLNMFHSRRPLIENYFKSKDEKYEQYIDNRNLRLVEEVRNESYPVFQDQHGTHIFRDKAMESYQEIQELSKYIDVFVIDGIFKDTAYLVDTVSNYRSLLDQFDIDKATKLSEQYASDHDSGFLYKKTGYQKAGVTK